MLGNVNLLRPPLSLYWGPGGNGASRNVLSEFPPLET